MPAPFGFVSAGIKSEIIEEWGVPVAYFDGVNIGCADADAVAADAVAAAVIFTSVDGPDIVSTVGNYTQWNCLGGNHEVIQQMTVNNVRHFCAEMDLDPSTSPLLEPNVMDMTFVCTWLSHVLHTMQIQIGMSDHIICTSPQKHAVCACFCFEGDWPPTPFSICIFFQCHRILQNFCFGIHSEVG